MASADQVRARWDAGDRADMIAIINGGGVDLDDSGAPLDDQWELIAGQLDTAPAEEVEPEPEPENPPLTDADLVRVAAEVAVDLDPDAWKAGLSPVEIRLIEQLRAATESAQLGHADATEIRHEASAIEARAASPDRLESDLWYATWLRERAAEQDADAERQLHEAIRAAVPQGQKPLVPVDRVASIAGLTRSRIYQIRDDRR